MRTPSIHRHHSTIPAHAETERSAWRIMCVVFGACSLSILVACAYLCAS